MPGLEHGRPGLGHVQHAMCKPPLVVEPDKQIGKMITVDTRLAGVDDRRVRVVIEIDRGVRMVRVRQQLWLGPGGSRSEEHTSELQSLMRISYAVFCLKKKKTMYTEDKII